VSEVELQPLGDTHLAGLERLFEDPDMQRFTRLPVPTSAGFARTWVERYETGALEGTRAGFAIVGADGRFLGIALAPRIDGEARIAELGYAVVPAARGRGVAGQALWLLTEWAFGELEALRLELLINVENDASKVVAQRCGYVLEGVMRSVYLKDGMRGDVELWSRLPADRPPLT
jgi:RimJ/RimL family protein N-acetyltransferase